MFLLTKVRTVLLAEAGDGVFVVEPGFFDRSLRGQLSQRMHF
jgi:hypothetical protein